MAHLLVADMHDRDEERQSLTAAADASVEGATSPLHRTIQARESALERITNCCWTFFDGVSRAERHTFIKAIIAACLFVVLLIVMTVLAVYKAGAQGDASAVVFPIVLLASLSLSFIVQLCRACAVAWESSSQRARAERAAWTTSAGVPLPRPSSRAPPPSPNDSAEAHIAYALRHSLVGAAAMRRAGLSPGSSRRAREGGSSARGPAGLDPFLAGQLRAAGMDDNAIARVALLMHAEDFSPEDYETLLALDEMAADVMIMADESADAEEASGRASGRSSRRHRRAQRVEVINPQAATRHEIGRLPTYVWQPKAGAAAVTASAGAVRPPLGHGPGAGHDIDGPMVTIEEGDKTAETQKVAGTGDASITVTVDPGADDVKGQGKGDGDGHNSAPFCNICLEHVEAGDKLRLLPCLHQFHQQCVDNWLHRKATCPVCKVSIRDPVWSAV